MAMERVIATAAAVVVVMVAALRQPSAGGDILTSTPTPSTTTEDPPATETPSKTPPTWRPKTTTAPQRCEDLRLNASAARGEFLQLPNCKRLLCAGAPARPRFVTQRCEPVLHESCSVTPGKKDAPFPDCCDVIICAGHQLQHAECNGGGGGGGGGAPLQKNQAVEVPGEPCGYIECQGYAFDPRTQRPARRFVKHTCSSPHPPRPLCLLEPGLAAAPFPLCCPREVCLVRERGGGVSTEEDDQ